MGVLGENYNFYGRGEWVLVHVYTYQLKVVVGGEYIAVNKGII